MNVRWSSRIPVIVLAGLVVSLAAQAGPIFVTPPGLSAGQQYRLVFVTSTTSDATSADIADYNQFVTNVADSAPALAALGASWYVLGETPSTSFATNADFTFSFTYRLDGDFVFGSLFNAYHGPLSSLITVDENGDPLTGIRIWTGLGDGTPGTGTLGQASTEFGDPGGLTGSGCSDCWGLHDGTAPNSNQYSLYAISSVLTVPAPEPATWLSGVFCAGICWRGARIRRSQMQG